MSFFRRRQSPRPALPVELYNFIVDEVCFDDSVLTCLVLVCQLLRGLAQLHLFRLVVVYLGKENPCRFKEKLEEFLELSKTSTPARELCAVYRMDRGGHTSTEREPHGPISYQMQEHTYLSLQNDCSTSIVYNRLARTRSSTGSSDQLYPQISETPLSRTLHVEQFPSPESTFFQKSQASYH